MWQPVLHIILGVWMACMPVLFDAMRGKAAMHNHIAGPLVITFGIIALWEVNRNAVKANIAVGCYLVTASFFIADLLVSMLNIITSVVLIATSFKDRGTKQNYGGGWKSLFQEQPPHMH